MYDGDAVQMAMYNALQAGTSVEWYDHVPPGTDYPYGVIGHITSAPFDLHNLLGNDSTATLHVWSASLGTAEINAVMTDMDTALHFADLVLPSGHFVGCQREFTEIMRDFDTATGRPLRHAVVRYRVLTTEAA